MKIQRPITLLLAATLIAGLAQAAPNPTKSEYLETRGGGISISGGNKPLYYSLILSVRKDLDEALHVRAFFERPGDSKNPLVVDSKIQPDQDTLFLDSPNFQGIENDKTYSTTVVLYIDEERKKEVSRHDQDVHFKVPKKAFKKLGLKRP